MVALHTRDSDLDATLGWSEDRIELKLSELATHLIILLYKIGQ